MEEGEGLALDVGHIIVHNCTVGVSEDRKMKEEEGGGGEKSRREE